MPKGVDKELHQDTLTLTLVRILFLWWMSVSTCHALNYSAKIPLFKKMAWKYYTWKSSERASSAVKLKHGRRHHPHDHTAKQNLWNISQYVGGFMWQLESCRTSMIVGKLLSVIIFSLFFFYARIVLKHQCISQQNLLVNLCYESILKHSSGI